MNTALEQFHRVNEYLRKREGVILEFESKLLSGNAFFDGLEKATRVLKTEGVFQGALLKQRGLVINSNYFLLEYPTTAPTTYAKGQRTFTMNEESLRRIVGEELDKRLKTIETNIANIGEEISEIRLHQVAVTPVLTALINSVNGLIEKNLSSK